LGVGKGCRTGRRRVVGPLGGGAPGNEQIVWFVELFVVDCEALFVVERVS